MKIYFKLLNFAKPLSRFLPKYAILAVLAVIFGLINFTLLIPLLNVLFGTTQTDTVTTLPSFSFSIDYFKDAFNYTFSHIFNTYGKIGALQFVCVVLVISVFLSNLFKYWSQRVLTNMRTYVVQNIRKELFSKITDLNIGFFHNSRKGDILSSLSNDVTEIENSVVSSVQVIFREPLMIIGYVIILFIMSVKLTLFTLIILPVSGLIITTISRKLRKEAKKGQEILGNILSIIEETISGLRIIKSFNAQKYVHQKFDDQNGAYRKVLKDMWNRRELASPLSELMGVMVIAGILLYGGSLVLNNQGELSASEFLTYIVFYSQILVPAKAISSAVTNIQRGIASGERIFQITNTENPIKEPIAPISKNDFEKEILIKNVSFAYNSEKVLNNLNLSIEKGKMIALVGQSGAGKTTLADLIPRFYDVTEGEILIDKINIKNISLNDLNHLMGIVSQESILFNDSILNNIAFGIEEPNLEKVMHAAKVANAHNFIMEMENQYETNIGDRGGKLSGGQKQRIAIARAVLKNPPILILDEATSALDTESERLVQDALFNLMKNRTTIVIAHRLSTIKNADEILVMNKGEIIERGNHNQLMEKNGGYKRLVDLQAFN